MTGQHGLALAMNLTRHVQVSLHRSITSAVFSVLLIITSSRKVTFGLTEFLSFFFVCHSLCQTEPRLVWGSRSQVLGPWLPFQAQGFPAENMNGGAFCSWALSAGKEAGQQPPILKPQHTLRGHLVPSLFCSATPVLPWNHRWVTQLRMLFQVFRTPNLIRDQQS